MRPPLPAGAAAAAAPGATVRPLPDSAPRSSPALPASSERRLLTILLLLTAASGVIDAVAFLGLGQVFVANQTGNVMLLAISLPAGAGTTSVAGSIVSICAFVAGAVAGGRLAPGRILPSGVPDGAVRALLIESAFLLAALGLWLAAHDRAGVRLAITALLGVGLGIQAATARRVARTGISTVVLTSAIVGLAVDSPGASGRPDWWRHALPVGVMAAGGVVGAALAASHAAAVALGIALGVSAACAAMAARP
ncbi:MAG: YoaK family protein [Solirubrobacteraceae bacterium]